MTARTVTVPVRLDPAVLARVDALAAAAGTSRAEVIRGVLAATTATTTETPSAVVSPPAEGPVFWGGSSRHWHAHRDCWGLRRGRLDGRSQGDFSGSTADARTAGCDRGPCRVCLRTDPDARTLNALGLRRRALGVGRAPAARAMGLTPGALWRIEQTDHHVNPAELTLITSWLHAHEATG